MISIPTSLTAGVFLAATVVAQCSESERSAETSIVSARAPVTLAVSGDRSTERTSGGIVELTLVPRVLGQGEDFLIAVSPGSFEIDAEPSPNVVSFFPPPVIDESRQFFIDLQDHQSGEIVVQLIPAGDEPIETTQIEITSARWAEP